MQNMQTSSNRLDALKAQLATLERKAGTGRRVGAHAPDDDTPAGLTTPGAVHDLYAEAEADAVSVNAFGLGLALNAASGRPLVWGLHEAVAREVGQPHGPGLHEMGLRTRDVLLVRARDVQTLLAIGEEALRTPAVGAVLLSAWGEARALTLTASRRLALAAEAGGGTLFLARIAADPAPSAAETRWLIRSAASEPLEAGAPGRPSFSVTLLRRRGGGALRSWIVEWDRDGRRFRQPATLSCDLVPLAAQRPAEASGTGRRRVA